MTIAVGARLGPYEIISALGAGGMGEVYRARDPRLGRDVAVKVLPAAFSADPERLHRFEQEARAAAALNHPNILAVYDIGQHDGSPYIVSELLEGETLRERLNGGALPVRKAVEFAVQVAHGLAAAHEKSILHRDLKPENIFVTTDGRIKILDFGLAKLTEAEPALVGASALPTSPLPSSPGIVLGTVGYMSPEQARGIQADHRSDIFAFGVVLYEMLAGRRAFQRDTVLETMTAILRDDPPELASTRSDVPPAVERIVQHCLEKNPNDRFQTARDLIFALKTLTSDSRGVSVVGSGPELRRSSTLRGLFIPAVWVMAGALLALTGVFAWQPRVTHVPGFTRFTMPVPTGFTLLFGQNPRLAISPDGTKIVYEAAGRLYLRTMDRFDPEPIPGTEGADIPFFSPDGAWLGFVRGGALMKIAVGGSSPIRIANVSALGASWGQDGRIIFAGGLGNGGLWSVSEQGGVPKQLTTVSEAESETNHVWPQILPDGAVLYTALGPSGHAADARIVVQDFARGMRTVVAEGVTFGRYTDAGGGCLLYVDANGALLLQPFNLRSRRTGAARAVLSGVRRSVWGGAVPFVLSSTGTIAYATGTEFEESILTEIDLAGRERRRFGSPKSFSYPAVSPDGGSLAMSIRSPLQDDIYLMDVTSGRFDRFSFEVTEDESPIWSPDGRHIAYSSAWVGEQRRVYVKTINSSEPARLLYTGKRHLHLSSWSPDGEWIAFYEWTSRSIDAWLLGVSDKTRLVPLANSENAQETDAHFSPDGKWLAYASDESGRYEVYVVSFPDRGLKKQVSRAGGFAPRWSPTGQELYFFDQFFNMQGRMMMAGRTGTSEWREPMPLFDVPRVRDYAVARDGRSFYFVAQNPDGPARDIRVVVNWLQEVLSPGVAPATK